MPFFLNCFPEMTVMLWIMDSLNGAIGRILNVNCREDKGDCLVMFRRFSYAKDNR